MAKHITPANDESNNKQRNNNNRTTALELPAVETIGGKGRGS